MARLENKVANIKEDAPSPTVVCRYDAKHNAIRQLTRGLFNVDSLTWLCFVVNTIRFGKDMNFGIEAILSGKCQRQHETEIRKFWQSLEATVHKFSKPKLVMLVYELFNTCGLLALKNIERQNERGQGDSATGFRENMQILFEMFEQLSFVKQFVGQDYENRNNFMKENINENKEWMFDEESSSWQEVEKTAGAGETHNINKYRFKEGEYGKVDEEPLLLETQSLEEVEILKRQRQNGASQVREKVPFTGVKTDNGNLILEKRENEESSKNKFPLWSFPELSTVNEDHEVLGAYAVEPTQQLKKKACSMKEPKNDQTLKDQAQDTISRTSQVQCARKENVLGAFAVEPKQFIGAKTDDGNFILEKRENEESSKHKLHHGSFPELLVNEGHEGLGAYAVEPTQHLTEKSSSMKEAKYDQTLKHEAQNTISRNFQVQSVKKKNVSGAFGVEPKQVLKVKNENESLTLELRKNEESSKNNTHYAKPGCYSKRSVTEDEVQRACVVEPTQISKENEILTREKKLMISKKGDSSSRSFKNNQSEATQEGMSEDDKDELSGAVQRTQLCPVTIDCCDNLKTAVMEKDEKILELEKEKKVMKVVNEDKKYIRKLEEKLEKANKMNDGFFKQVTRLNSFVKEYEARKQEDERIIRRLRREVDLKDARIASQRVSEVYQSLDQ